MKQNWKLENMSKTNPFRVPDGYFETLTSRVMARLPQESPVHIASNHSVSFRTLYFAAAVFLGFVLFSGSIQHFSQMPDTKSDVAMQDSLYMDEMMNYTMMDCLTLHQYLTDASME